MLVSQKSLDSIKTIGLNKYERNLWIALLAKSSASAGELSAISKVPRSRCYDVLESLSEKGFVMLQPGKPMKYLAINPKEAMERAKKKVLSSAESTVKSIDILMKSESIKELERLFKSNMKSIQPHDMLATLRGKDSMIEHAQFMIKSAKKNIKILTTDSGLAEIAENHLNAIKKASESGVKIQIAANILKSADMCKELSKYAEIRSLQKSPVSGRFSIVDSQSAVVSLTDDSIHPTQDTAVWTQSQHASANIFEPMFDMLWEKSKPVK